MIFGFIGSGNMGGAIIGGIINSDIASSENVIVSDKNEQALKNINEKYPTIKHGYWSSRPLVSTPLIRSIAILDATGFISDFFNLYFIKI